ncbi:MAG: GNAT family N-acetyltransferase [Solirubrobacteraceae bacterium]
MSEPASALDRLETERLACGRPRVEDADELSGLMLHPDVLRTTWFEPQPPTGSYVADKLAGDIKHWERYGFGPWLLRDRAGGELVGRGGLKHTTATGLHEVEIGWTIDPARWGEGLATELARASVQTAFDVLGLDEVIAYTAPDNVSSWRVMEKAGMEFDREIVAVGLPQVLYRARRDRA